MVRRLLLQLSRADARLFEKVAASCGVSCPSIKALITGSSVTMTTSALAGSIGRHIRAVSVGAKVRPEHASGQHGK
jgi:hypothetical protein